MEFKVQLPNFICPDSIRPYLQHVFEGEYNVPINPLQPRILDLGANVGAFAIWATFRWPGATVFAYEPDRKNFDMLNQNLLENNITSVVAINRAVGTPGDRLFYIGKSNCGEGGFHSHILDRDENVPPAIKTVIDPLTLPQATILKMDIEGCELEVLEPLIKDGRKFDAVLVEYHRIEDRRRIDLLLLQYVLVGAAVYTPYRGIVKYVHQSLVLK